MLSEVKVKKKLQIPFYCRYHYQHKKHKAIDSYCGCVENPTSDRNIHLLRICCPFTLDWFIKTPSLLDTHPRMKVTMELAEVGWLDITVKQVKLNQKVTADSKIPECVFDVIHVQGIHTQKLSNIVPLREQMLSAHLNKGKKLCHRCSFQVYMNVHTQSYGVHRMVKTDLQWKAKQTFSVPNSDFYISLPGVTQSVSIRGTRTNSTGSLTVFWLHNQHVLSHHRGKGRFCSVWKNHKGLGDCVKFSSHLHVVSRCPQQFLLFGRESAQSHSHCPAKRKCSISPEVSWNRAASICHQNGGHLPLLRSKSEMSDFIVFLKVSENMFFFCEIAETSRETDSQRDRHMHVYEHTHKHTHTHTRCRLSASCFGLTAAQN